MNKKLFLVTIILVTLKITGQSQNLSNLDSRKGFQDFTLGDPLSKWSKDVTLLVKEDGAEFYNYNGNCCKSLFNYSIKNIELGFKNNSLVAINIFTEKIQKPYSESGKNTIYQSASSGAHKEVINQLQLLFGEFTGIDSGDGDSSTYSYREWAGKEVVLRFWYKYYGIKNGDDITVSICTKSFLLEKAKNKF